MKLAYIICGFIALVCLIALAQCSHADTPDAVLCSASAATSVSGPNGYTVTVKSPTQGACGTTPPPPTTCQTFAGYSRWSGTRTQRCASWAALYSLAQRA